MLAMFLIIGALIYGGGGHGKSTLQGFMQIFTSALRRRLWWYHLALDKTALRSLGRLEQSSTMSESVGRRGLTREAGECDILSEKHIEIQSDQQSKV